MVLRALGLGDLLTTVPALRALADAFPGHRRLLAAPRVLAPVAELTGAVDAVVHADPLAPLAPELGDADVAVNLHGRGPESHRVLEATTAKRVIAFANPEIRWSAGCPEWRAGEHEAGRWCRLLSESGVPADPGRLELEPPSLRLPSSFRGLTIVHPGAASPARRWPADRFAAVVRGESRAGRRVAITGDLSEAPLAREVARLAGLPQPTVLAGRTSLRQLTALVAHAARLVCGDTGVAHLATALGTPSVVLFGPVSPAEWGPPADGGPHVSLWAGRRGDPHAAEPDPGLLEIGVKDVQEALQGLTPMGPRGAGRPGERAVASRQPRPGREPRSPV